MPDTDRPLRSWNDTATRAAIVEFVESAAGPGGLPPEERVAVFDNDGTLSCEKPLPVQAGFLFGRLAEMAERDPSLVHRQPWKAVVENDHAWLGGAITKHYEGDRLLWLRSGRRSGTPCAGTPTPSAWRRGLGETTRSG